MSHDRDSDLRDQLAGLGLLGNSAAKKQPASPPARRQKAKPNPSKAAKKAASPKDEQAISITLVDEKPVQKKPARPKAKAPKAEAQPKAQTAEAVPPPRHDLPLLRLSGVSYGGMVGNFVLIARLRKNGARSLSLRFDVTHAARPRWEIQILPVDAERGPGWISCFHDGKSATALHVYDLTVAHRPVLQMAA